MEVEPIPALAGSKPFRTRHSGEFSLTIVDYMRLRKTYPLFLLFLILLLSGCSVFHDGKVSQDLLPWKKPGEVLFTDDFKNNNSGWETVNNAYELKSYSKSGYLISVTQPDSRAISTTNLNFSNIDLAVKAKKILGLQNTQLGLVCRYQDKYNFYSFVITTDGYAGILRFLDGQAELISGRKFIYTEVINQADAENIIEASCNFDEFTLSINGEQILTAKDQTFENGDAGLMVETFDEGNSAVLFNEFTITKP